MIRLVIFFLVMALITGIVGFGGTILAVIFFGRFFFFIFFALFVLTLLAPNDKKNPVHTGLLQERVKEETS